MRRLVAALVTLGAPGAGHLVLGLGRHAAAWIVVTQALIAAWLALFFLAPSAAVFAVLGLAVMWLGAVVDTLVVTRPPRVPRAPVVAVLVLLLVASVTTERLVLRRWALQAFSVASGSMRRSLEPGDFFLADRTAYRRVDPRRGEMVVFWYPRDPRRAFVMRVVGVPGDRLLLRGREVVINGATLVEPYVLHTLDEAAASPCRYPYGCGEITVPPGTFFVMGDNRDNAQDSRFFGFVGREALIGRATVIYWSHDPGSWTPRPERIATRL